MTENIEKLSALVHAEEWPTVRQGLDLIDSLQLEEEVLYEVFQIEPVESFSQLCTP